MPEEQFEKYKRALATIRLEKPKMLSSLCGMFWNEIVSQQYNFDRTNIEVAYLKTITQQQILDFYKVLYLALYTLFYFICRIYYIVLEKSSKN